MVIESTLHINSYFDNINFNFQRPYCINHSHLKQSIITTFGWLKKWSLENLKYCVCYFLALSVDEIHQLGALEFGISMVGNNTLVPIPGIVRQFGSWVLGWKHFGACL